MKRAPLLLSLLFLLSPVLADTLQRADGSEIVYYLDRPGRPSFALAVILQGSECLRVSDKYGAYVEQLNDAGLAVLRVEKPGLSPESPVGDCPEEYLRLNSIDRRVLDLLAVLGHLRRHESAWNRQLGLSGGSEGSMVAALAAPMLPETRALLLLSSGGGWEFGDEVKASIAAAMRASGASDEQVAQQMAKTDEEWKTIAEQPVPGKEWASDGKLGRNTYLWWNNAIKQATYRVLADLTVPTRVYQGTSDTSLPPESARRLAERMKEAGRVNFELREYHGDHAPPAEVLREAFDWLAEQTV